MLELKISNQFISVFILMTHWYKKSLIVYKQVHKTSSFNGSYIFKLIKKSQNPLVLVLVHEIVVKNMIFLYFNHKSNQNFYSLLLIIYIMISLLKSTHKLLIMSEVQLLLCNYFSSISTCFT